MIKRYSFNTERQAQDLILLLTNEDNKLIFTEITTTETTKAIVCLGFHNEYDKDGILIVEGTTYDVDVFWSDIPNEDWIQYEVTPNTPNHKFS